MCENYEYIILEKLSVKREKRFATRHRIKSEKGKDSRRKECGLKRKNLKH